MFQAKDKPKLTAYVIDSICLGVDNFYLQSTQATIPKVILIRGIINSETPFPIKSV
jgi:hypothetical protein